MTSTSSIAGGGETLAAIAKFGVAERFSYLSTGGGAFLEFLQGKTLPALAILKERAKADPDYVHPSEGYRLMKDPKPLLGQNRLERFDPLARR